MAADATRLALTAEAQPIAHEDSDYQAGHTFQLKCPTAKIYVGGQSVTNAAGVKPGYVYEAGDELVVTDAKDLVYVCVDAASAPAEAQILWLGV